MSTTKLMTKPKNRFARYGPSDRYESPPPAGMCLSVFVLVKREGKKGILIGLPRPDNRWPTEWITSWRTYSDKDLARSYSQWRLPSVYLGEGEHPVEAVGRIMKDQLQISDFSLVKKSPKIFSYLSPSDWYPGNSHWDLAFVYEVSVNAKDVPDKKKSLPRWWQEISFFKKKKDFRGKDYGWNSDLMIDLGLLEKLEDDAELEQEEEDGKIPRKNRGKKQLWKSHGEDVKKQSTREEAEEDEEPEGRILLSGEEIDQ